MTESCNNSHANTRGVYTPRLSFRYSHFPRLVLLSSSFRRKQTRGVYTLAFLSLSFLAFFLSAEASMSSFGEFPVDFSSSSLSLSARSLSSNSSFLSNEGQAPPRRLQAGVYYSEDDRARKGQIYLWLSLTLVGVLILVVLYLLKIASVFDPLLHTRFTPSDRTR